MVTNPLVYTHFARGHFFFERQFTQLNERSEAMRDVYVRWNSTYWMFHSTQLKGLQDVAWRVSYTELDLPDATFYATWRIAPGCLFSSTYSMLHVYLKYSSTLMRDVFLEYSSTYWMLHCTQLNGVFACEMWAVRATTYYVGSLSWESVRTTYRNHI